MEHHNDSASGDTPLLSKGQEVGSVLLRSLPANGCWITGLGYRPYSIALFLHGDITGQAGGWNELLAPELATRLRHALADSMDRGQAPLGEVRYADDEGNLRLRFTNGLLGGVCFSRLTLELSPRITFSI